jgi:hypothetical protein
MRKLKVGSVIYRQAEAVGQLQCFAPSVGVRILICGDVQEGKICKSSTAEIRIYATPTHGYSQTIGDL